MVFQSFDAPVLYTESQRRDIPFTILRNRTSRNRSEDNHYRESVIWSRDKMAQKTESAMSDRTSNGRRRRTRCTTAACNSSQKSKNSGSLCTGRPVEEPKMLTTVCQDARFTTTVPTGQLSVTRSTSVLEEPGITSSYRECTLPHDEQGSYKKGTIGNNTKMGLALDVLVAKHHGRYGVEIKTVSLARVGTC